MVAALIAHVAVVAVLKDSVVYQIPVHPADVCFLLDHAAQDEPAVVDQGEAVDQVLVVADGLQGKLKFLRTLGRVQEFLEMPLHIRKVSVALLPDLAGSAVAEVFGSFA